jgi:hypothetical protein
MLDMLQRAQRIAAATMDGTHPFLQYLKQQFVRAEAMVNASLLGHVQAQGAEALPTGLGRLARALVPAKPAAPASIAPAAMEALAAAAQAARPLAISVAPTEHADDEEAPTSPF